MTGLPLGRAVRLPDGYAIYRATERGLLLAPVSSGSGPQVDKLWNPADRTASRTFDSVLAASPTEIAWTPAVRGNVPRADAGPGNGQAAAVNLPAGTFAQGAAFSQSGKLLAIEVMSEESDEPSIRTEVAPTAAAVG